MNPRPTNSLRRKLVAYCVLLILLVGGGSALVDTLLGRVRAVKSHEAKNLAIANLLAGGLADDLQLGDFRQASRALRAATRSNPAIISAMVTDGRGTVLADASDDQRSGSLRRDDAFAAAARDRLQFLWREQADAMEAAGPIRDPSGQVRGHLIVRFSLEDAHRAAHAATLTHLILTAVFLAVGLLAAVVFSGRMTQPVLDLVRATEDIRQGRFTTRVHVERDDELGLLGETINAMAEGLETTTVSKDLLAEAHRELQAKYEEQKKTEAALAEAKRAADAANEAKGRFLANVSHELRTPMTAILGFAEILDENASRQEDRDALDTIRRNGEYLLRLIEDILDLSKIEADKLRPELIPCSPQEFLDEVASLMRVRAEAKGLPLAVATDGPLPELVSTDPTRLRQILINLVANAVKFTEVGSVRVTARFLDGDARPSRLQFEVADTGVGMTPAQIERIFEPFVQADTSTTRKFGGTGLGLAISKRLAAVLGGDIAVTSQPGKGSCFRATIVAEPVEPPSSTDRADAEAFDNAEAAAPSPKSACRLNCRVLLAEDAPDIQRLLRFLLEKAGAEVSVASNGQEAVDRALAADEDAAIGCGPPDVILMDVQMPVMDGHQATRRLREAGFDGPILALTAHASRDDMQACIDAGCNGYLTKPVDREGLIAAVARYVGQAASLPA